MKDYLKRGLVVVLAAVMLAAFIPNQALAASIFNYSVKKLGQNTQVDAVSYSGKYDEDKNAVYTYNLYQINVPANGYVTFKKSNSKAMLYIFKSVPSGKPEKPDAFITAGKTVNYKVLAKGKWYVLTSADTKFSWSFTKAAKAVNTCRADAKKLARNKTEKIVFNDGQENSRWYKIKLSNKKAVKITYKALDFDITKGQGIYLYNSKGEKVDLKVAKDAVTYKTGTLAKGTYYIRLDYYYMSAPWLSYARIVNLKWK